MVIYMHTLIHGQIVVFHPAKSLNWRVAGGIFVVSIDVLQGSDSLEPSSFTLL